MDNPNVLLLSAIVFLPALGALVLAFLPKDQEDLLRSFTLLVTAVVLGLTVVGFLTPSLGGQFEHATEAAAYMQDVFNLPWIPSFDINYFMGVDGISFPLVMLTAFVSFLAMAASWSVTQFVKGYCILFLLLETGMLGVFLALDFFLFYVFWEVMLLPMYFLIGVWGGPRREYAAIKFFLYTVVGSVLMLIAILMLYFYSDVRELAKQALSEPDSAGRATCGIRWEQLHLGAEMDARIGQHVTGSPFGERKNARIVFLRGKQDADKPLAVRFQTAAATATAYDAATSTLTVSLSDALNRAADVVAAVKGNPDLPEVVQAALAEGSDGSGTIRAGTDDFTLAAFNPRMSVHTFSILALTAMGQHTTLFDAPMLFGKSLQWWVFLLLLAGFVIKVPSVPVHTWLPDAHVEAPTPISMILAGVLLKMGGYGIIRICYPICPHGGYDLAYFVCLLGVVSMVYGAFAAMAQNDFKRLVAYSSVSHMGYVVLGFGVWSATAGLLYNSSYWNMGIKGAMFQMIAHGISSSGMFFLVGVLYDRVHHRNLNEFGGIFAKMPVYAGLSIGIFFAGLGLPGLCGFIGEVLVVLSVWNYSSLLAIISAAVVILTAAYILWAVQRVYLGPEYKGPHEEALVPSNRRENLIAGTLVVFAILLGVFPQTFVLRYMDKTIDRQVGELTAWTKYVKELKEHPSAAGTVSTTAVQHQGVGCLFRGTAQPDGDRADRKRLPTPSLTANPWVPDGPLAAPGNRLAVKEAVLP
jgi:NADH-quinone oxidoreductase subunit M